MLNMGWRVSGDQDRRWVETTPGGWVADLESTEWIRRAMGQPVGPPLGELWAWQGVDDPVWLFYAALNAVPTPHVITGVPPKVPAPTSRYPDGAVF